MGSEMCIRDSILDVAHQLGPIQLSNHPGHSIRGSAVIEGKVTDVIDVPGVIRSAGIDFCMTGEQPS